MFTILTKIGRAAQAEAFRNLNLYMAFGSGQTYWGTSMDLTRTFDGSNNINVGYTEIDNVHVYPPDAGIPSLEYTDGVDYTVNKATGVVHKLNGGGIPTGNVRVAFYVKPPTGNPDATDLVSELARKQIFTKQYVTPHVSGSITIGSSKYNLSESPTPYLYLACDILQSELTVATIREVSVFASPVFLSTPPEGTVLFTPDMFLSKGKIITLKNYPGFIRNEAAKETFELVIPF